MKRFALILIIVLIATFYISCSSRAEVPPSSLAWTDFLNGSSEYWLREMPNNTYSGTISGAYSRNEEPSFRVELRDMDANVFGGKRSEISTIYAEAPGSESVYQFSILLPEGGVEDYTIDPEGSEIIVQWHNTPDPGEEWTHPPLSIRTGAYYKSDPSHYILEVNWDESPITTENSLKRARYDLGSFTQDKGKWVDWKVHVKWGWLPSQNPYIEIFKNGNKIFELSDHPNTTNDNVGMKMKLGLYKWDWDQEGSQNRSRLSKRVIYYSNVDIKNKG